MKRFFVVLLMLALILGLFGCTAEEAVPETTAAETTLAEETAAAEDTLPATTTAVTEPVYDLSTWQGNYDLGLSHMEKKEWQEAIAAFDAAISLNPQQPDAYAKRGNARIFFGETKETLSLAWEDYQQSLSIDETNAFAHLGIVDVHIRRGEYDKADAAMAAALKITNNDPHLSKMSDFLQNGIYLDSSYTYRRKTKSWYNNDQDFLGTVVEEYENGVAVSAESFNPSGKTTGFVELSTVVNGNVTERVWYNVGIGETEVVVTKAVQKTTVHEDGTSERESFSFGKNGKPGSSAHTYFDAEGNETRHESYGSDGKLQFYSTAEYDSEGRVIRSSNYNPDGTLREYTVHFYDSEGRQNRSEFYNGNDELINYRLNVRLDDGRLQAHETYTPEGELIHKVVFE